MPPRQGQSQLISPVSSLKAPSREASDSVAEGSRAGEGFWFGSLGEGVDGGGSEALRAWAIDSRVGRDVSSVGESGSRGSSTVRELAFRRLYRIPQSLRVGFSAKRELVL